MKQASEKRECVFNGLWLLILIAATSFWCVHTARSLSATFDEPTYLEDGLAHWRTGSYKPLMRLGTMPLAVDVQTLPLYLWERAHGTAIDTTRDIGWILAWARSATLLFWGLLLVYVFRIARSIGGSWAGRIASALVACEPNLLAHASLATTDIPLTAMLMVFAYEFHASRGVRAKGVNCKFWPIFGRLWESRRVFYPRNINLRRLGLCLREIAAMSYGWWLLRLGIPSVLYGLAILAKASALVFAPLFMVVIEFHRLWRSEDFSKIAGAEWKVRFTFFRDGLWAFRHDFLRIIGLGLLVIFLYCRSDWTTEPTFVKWAQGLKPGALHDSMLWTSEHLRIFTNAGEGLSCNRSSTTCGAIPPTSWAKPTRAPSGIIFPSRLLSNAPSIVLFAAFRW